MRELARLMRDNRLFAQENQADRLRLLQTLYGEGKGKKCLIPLEFLSSANWDRGKILRATFFLEEKGLLITRIPNPKEPQPTLYLALTQEGIIEAERAIDCQIEATGHFKRTIRIFRGWATSLLSLTGSVLMKDWAKALIPKIAKLVRWLIWVIFG